MEEFLYPHQAGNTARSAFCLRELLCPQEASLVPEVTANNLTISWTKDDSKLVLKNVSFQLTQVRQNISFFLVLIKIVI